MFFRCLPIITLYLFLTACVGLNTVSLTQIPKDRGQVVSVTSSDWSFLGIDFDNAFVDKIPEELMQQCPKGRIEGILTKYQTTSYILIYKREVIVKGYCKGVSS